MQRLVIVGGGISGLIASWVFQRVPGLDVKVLEIGKPGGDFLAGGLKYLHKTDEMVAMLEDLGVTHTDYSVQGGILLKGVVEPYPACMRGVDKDRALRIQHDHYRKTRGIEPDSFAARSMNDPEATGPRTALRCDMQQTLRRLIARANIVADRADKIEPHRVTGSSGAVHKYDFMITTVPLWVMKQLSWFDLPDAMAAKLNLVMVDPNPRMDNYARWDYVYTPYTPENLIHRLTPRDGGYTCEFNGRWADEDSSMNDRITSEMNFLFPEGWALSNVVKNLNGHLLPLPTRPSWPFNIRPLGRFAQWDPRATSDVVLTTAQKLVREWKMAQ